MLNIPPLEEYIEATGRIRELINYPEIHPSLKKDKSKHAMLSSCLDTIGDTDRCLEAFINTDMDKLERNEQYIYIYGTLQAFVVQQDSVRHLLDALDISSPLDTSSLSSLMNIREIRNRVTGHPTKTGTDIGDVFNFIPRNQIKNEEFQLNAYYIDGDELKFKYETVKVRDLIATQRRILKDVLAEVIKTLKEQKHQPTEKRRITKK